jgi:hypothetical protein
MFHLSDPTSWDPNHQICSPQFWEGRGLEEGGWNEDLGNGKSHYLPDRKVVQKR